MQFDFACTKTTTTGGLQKTQCMFCNTVFTNVKLKPSELQNLFNNHNGEANVSGYDVES